VALFAFVTTWAPGFLWGWNGMVLGVGITMVAIRVPQCVELVKTRHAQGVSVGSWVFSMFTSLLWVIYYFDIHAIAPLASATASMVVSALISGLAAWRHRQASYDLAAEVIVTG
jgi:uncharacterized protein with PQ loop repeat